MIMDNTAGISITACLVRVINTCMIGELCKRDVQSSDKLIANNKSVGLCCLGNEGSGGPLI